MRDSTEDLVPDVAHLVAGGLARGRARRRRRQVTTSLAGAGAVAAMTVGVALLPGVLGGSQRSAPYVGTGEAASDGSATASPSPRGPSLDPRRAPDVPIVVSAEEIPAIVGDLAGGGTVGKVLQDTTFPLVDQPQEKLVHFLYDGTLTTVGITRADSLASCRALARDDKATTCEVVDGLLTLTTPVTTSDGVGAQDVWVWNHGWIVSVESYNAAGGKDVEPVTDVPPLDEQQLTTIAHSEEWFGTSPAS